MYQTCFISLVRLLIVGNRLLGALIFIKHLVNVCKSSAFNFWCHFVRNLIEVLLTLYRSLLPTSCHFVWSSCERQSNIAPNLIKVQPHFVHNVNFILYVLALNNYIKGMAIVVVFMHAEKDPFNYIASYKETNWQNCLI